MSEVTYTKRVLTRDVNLIDWNAEPEGGRRPERQLKAGAEVHLRVERQTRRTIYTAYVHEGKQYFSNTRSVWSHGATSVATIEMHVRFHHALLARQAEIDALDQLF